MNHTPQNHITVFFIDFLYCQISVAIYFRKTSRKIFLVGTGFLFTRVFSVITVSHTIENIANQNGGKAVEFSLVFNCFFLSGAAV